MKGDELVMKQSGRRLVHMARLRRLIAERLQKGATLSSPQVVALSQRLDRLVLECYRTS